MEEFIATVGDPRLRARLDQAIAGRGAFRRFKDVLLADPAERERWFDFQAAHVRVRVLICLADERIEPLLSD